MDTPISVGIIMRNLLMIKSFIPISSPQTILKKKEEY